MEALKQRSLDFCKDTYQWYVDKGIEVDVFYEKDADGNKYPSIMHIHENQRLDWGMKHHVTYMGNEGKNFNPILDWNEAEKINQLGPANQ